MPLHEEYDEALDRVADSIEGQAIVRLREERKALKREVETLRGKLRRSGKWAESCFKRWEKAEAERDRLREELAEDRRFCLCGCPISDHENYGEDGESCGEGDHVCLCASAAIVSIFIDLREENERLGDTVAHLSSRIEAALALLRDDIAIVKAEGRSVSWLQDLVKALQGEGKQHGGDGDSCPICSTKQARIEKLVVALDALLPAAHRAQSLCSSGESLNFCNDWDEQDAMEYAKAIETAERTLGEVAGEPEKKA